MDRYIENTPRLKSRALADLYRRALAQCSGEIMQLEIAHRCYTLSSEVSSEGRVQAINFRWIDGDRVREQRIELSSRRNHLAPCYIYMFICPHTGKRVRSLYIDEDGRMRSRHSMGLLYRVQHTARGSSTRILCEALSRMIKNSAIYLSQAEGTRKK